MKLALKFEALFEGAGLALGCGVSPGAFFIITANTQIHEVIQTLISPFLVFAICHSE